MNLYTHAHTAHTHARAHTGTHAHTQHTESPDKWTCTHTHARTHTHSTDQIWQHRSTWPPVYRIPSWLWALVEKSVVCLQTFYTFLSLPHLTQNHIPVIPPFLLFPVGSQHLQLTPRSEWLTAVCQWHLPNPISCNARALWDTDGYHWEKRSVVK